MVKKIHLCKASCLVWYFSQKNDFETQDFEIFDKVVHNFGKPDEVII